MEEEKRSKRNWMIYTTAFSYKYMSYLLPALLNARGNNKTANIEKIVRFEVDMALVSSTGEFKWSRALKRKLEEGKKSGKFRISPKCRSMKKLNSHFLCCIRSSPVIDRPIFVTKSEKRPKRISKGRCLRNNYIVRGEDGLGFRVRILRQILPGGNEMEVSQLLSEVQSYVVCLQLQVNILRSLVNAH